MQTYQRKWVLLQIGGAFLTLTSGLVLICLLNWAVSAALPTNVALGLAGVCLCCVGFKLFFFAMTDCSTPVKADGIELGCMDLNGYHLVAYERETADGEKQFRLACSQTLSPQQEAALIRYLALEGFLVSLWPEMKGRIEEEAGWAFLAF